MIRGEGEEWQEWVNCMYFVPAEASSAHVQSRVEVQAGKLGLTLFNEMLSMIR
jgi:hypothetical protein